MACFRDRQPSTVMGQELIDVIGNMPMSTLANRGGMSLDHDALDRISTAWRASDQAG